jgi:AcrR family transcriptional regulator
MADPSEPASTVPPSRIARRRQAALTDGAEAYKAKRQELIRVAATIFKERGYEGATLNEIAERFGTDRASLYYYVAGKEELFQEAVRGVLDDNVDEATRIAGLDLSARERMRMIVSQLVASYEANYPHMYVYIQEDMRKVVHEESPWARQMARQTRRFERIVHELVKEGIERGEFRDDLSPELAANALFGMVNWTHRWFRPGRRRSQEVADAFCTVFIEGMQKAS